MVLAFGKEKVVKRSRRNACCGRRSKRRQRERDGLEEELQRIGKTEEDTMDRKTGVSIESKKTAKEEVNTDILI